MVPFISYTPDTSSDAHLLGQHTIRMSPISTAQLNPHAHTFCLSPNTGNTVLIPVLLNNTDVGNLRYTLVPLGYDADKGDKIEFVELSQRDIKAIEASRVEGMQVMRPANTKRDVNDDDYDEYDDGDEEQETDDRDSSLQKTQKMIHVRLRKPGTVRLERVLDTSNVAARLLNHPVEVTVVPCPQAEFAPDKLEPMRCAGQDPDLELAIDIRGVPPLSLRYFKDVNGRREHFLVEGIEVGQGSEGEASSEFPLVNGRRKTRVASELKVPLRVSLNAIGKHTYVLEEVIDGMGNSVTVEHPQHLRFGLAVGHMHGHDVNATLHDNSKTTRSLTVLRRPSMAFRGCGPNSPASLLIGSETRLTVAAIDADSQDAPWEVSFKYQPPASDSDKGVAKRFKPWKKTLHTQKEKKELVLGANAPGEYTIVAVKGKVRTTCWIQFAILFIEHISSVVRGRCHGTRYLQSDRKTTSDR